MSVVEDYPVFTKNPQSALHDLLDPSPSQEARLDAVDQERTQRVAQLLHAADLRHERRANLARQRYYDGFVDIVGCRQEITAADAALAVERRDVPPETSRVDLRDGTYAVTALAGDAFRDKWITSREKEAAAWTQATIEQADGGSDDDE